MDILGKTKKIYSKKDQHSDKKVVLMRNKRKVTIWWQTKI